MPKTIAIIGSLDTKGAEFAFLKSEIEKQGCQTIVINVGILGEPGFTPEISSDLVAEAGGSTIAALRKLQSRSEALDIMSRGVAVISKNLFETGKFHGMISMGGGGGTAIATSAMRELPIGLPKLMVSTLASGETAPYVGTTDITMMPSIVDISGLNPISRSIFTNAAGAIVGMVMNQGEKNGPEKPLIAASMFGNTTRAVDQARSILNDHGYEVLVFHATGTGGKTMEMLIDQGYFAGVMDVTTTELADEICGGVFSAGQTRLEAATKAGIPQVVTPACIDMCNFWSLETIPDHYRNRHFYQWNPNVTIMRTTPEENARMGEAFAAKLNPSRGPVVILIPLRGFSEVDAPGQPFWWPEADQAFIDSLKKHLRSDIPVLMLDYNVNDVPFANKVAETLLEIMK